MFRLLVVVVAICVSATGATTCTDCKSTYGSADKSTNALTCTAWKAYMTCLETSALTDAGCPLSSTDAAAVIADHDAVADDCDLSSLGGCSCQKTYWGTDQTSTSGQCTSIAAYLQCLTATTENACDDSTTPAELLTAGTADLVALECGSGAGSLFAMTSLVLSAVATTMF